MTDGSSNMDISSVIALLVGLASLFAGIIFGMIGSANKERYLRQDKAIAEHANRLQRLEQLVAVSNAQFETLVQKLDELGRLLTGHVHHHKRETDMDDGR